MYSSHSSGSSSGGDTSSTPSPVLHVRNVPPNCVNEDLVSFASSFGPVRYVMMLAKFHQALVEMEQLQSAMAVVEYNKRSPIYIRDRPVQFSYSRSQTIKRREQEAAAVAAGAVGGGHLSNASPSHVLLVTVYNPLHPITTDVIHTIMAPYGNVQRIVIFTRSGVQALVEFDAVEPATAALHALDGRDIYQNSCTLKIVYSKESRLNVKFNNERQRDYTNPNLPVGNPDHIPIYTPPGSQPMSRGGGASDYRSGAAPQEAGYYAASANAALSDPMRTVLILHGLSASASCDGIFNLLCQYGNVVKVKLLAQKPGAALVQFESSTHADVCLSHMSEGAACGAGKIEVSRSKHHFVTERGDADGTVKSFAASNYHRFHGPISLKSRMAALLSAAGAPPPRAIKFFSVTASGKSKNGLMDMGSVSAAVDCLMCAQHLMMDGHTLKMSFSAQRELSPGAAAGVAGAYARADGGAAQAAGSGGGDGTDEIAGESVPVHMDDAQTQEGNMGTA